MKKIIFALAMSLFMIPAMAQHHDNHHDNHHDVHHDDHHNHHDDRHHPAPVIRIASPEEVAIIRQLVHDLSSSWDQAKAVKTCMQLAPMRAEDLASIIHMISFDDSKMDVLEFCYPLCPNKEKYTIAIEELSFRSNKEKMYKFIARH